MAAPSDQRQQAESPREYLLWPRKPITPEEQKKTEDAIRSILGSEEPIRNYTSQLDGLRFWFCELTATQAEEVAKLDRVLNAHPIYWTQHVLIL